MFEEDKQKLKYMEKDFIMQENLIMKNYLYYTQYKR